MAPNSAIFKNGATKKAVTTILLIFSQFSMLRGYKIKRTNCSVVEDGVVYCSCGGIGDPFAIILNRGPKPDMGLPYYGTRFGHNFALQVKQALQDHNLTAQYTPYKVTKIVYSDCQDHPLRLKLDFSEFAWDPAFKVDLRHVKDIEFRNVQSINIYLTKSITWGRLNIKFTDINSTHDYGYGHEAAVIVRGNVNFCKDPCQASDGDYLIDIDDLDEEDKKNGNGREYHGLGEFVHNGERVELKDGGYCNLCDPESGLTLVFDRISELLFSDFVVDRKTHGTTGVQMSNVNILRVEGGSYDGLAGDITAGVCKTYDLVTNCSDLLELGSVKKKEVGVAGIVVGAMAVILVFIIILAILLTFKLKPVPG